MQISGAIGRFCTVLFICRLAIKQNLRKEGDAHRLNQFAGVADG
jgi:hypothetical protein